MLIRRLAPLALFFAGYLLGQLAALGDSYAHRTLGYLLAWGLLLLGACLLDDMRERRP